MTNKTNQVVYTGVTNNIIRRIYEHKQHLVTGFTQKYKVTKLIYYEVFDYLQDAIAREKKIKGWVRKKKVDLIQSMNPRWEDLYEKLL